MNLNYIGPLLMRFGTPDQQQELLPPMARGEVLWTQLFSEPDAGSDLASLRTRAEDCGGHFVVNGQKIWSSYADAPADWGLLLARTNAGVAKHAGISVFVLDMTTPGDHGAGRSPPWPVPTSSTRCFSTTSSYRVPISSVRKTAGGRSSPLD